MDTVRVCALPDTGWGMTAEQFRGLVREGATKNKDGYIVPFDFPRMEYVFVRKSPRYPNAFTQDELDFVINDVLKQRMFARIGLSYPPVRILEENQPIPPAGQRYGIVLVLKETDFTFGGSDRNGDGINDEGFASLADGLIKESHVDQIMAELGGPFMPEEVNTNYRSVFYRSSFYPTLQRGDPPAMLVIPYALQVMRAGYGKVHVDKALRTD